MPEKNITLGNVDATRVTAKIVAASFGLGAIGFILLVSLLGLLAKIKV